jgi:catechol 1,2-dioxygenase
MSVKVTHTPEVQAFLNKIAGLDNTQGNDRVKQIVHRVVGDIFKTVEDFDVTPEEFWSAVYYLNELGARGEAALLAPGLGMDHYLDIRMDAEDAEKGLVGGTPRTIEGPLYVSGAPISDGFARMDDCTQQGDTVIITGVVKDEQGNPLPGAVVDIWHADLKGRYSYFDQTQSDYNLRRRIVTDENGRYTARSIVPSGYGCPPDGSTQQLLNLLGRHGQRPAHIHYFISKQGYRHLTTQINVAGDEYTYDDFAFATRDELVVEAHRVTDAARADKYQIESDTFMEMVFDIQLLKSDTDENQVRHARKRALENEAA